MKQIKNFIRKIIPRPIMNGYHYLEARLAAVKYGHPARKMVVIGVAGSKGKSTLANMIWAVLSASGAKVGQTGTANFRIGQTEKLNPYHMTMPGPFILQDWLARMTAAGCKYAVIETPSEAQVQYRHIGINYDVLVFTNITNELVAAHKFNLDQLIKDNSRVFAGLGRSRRKNVEGVRIHKTIITNADAPQSSYYGSFTADDKLSYGLLKNADIKAKNVQVRVDGTSFQCDGDQYRLKLTGEVNVKNALGAIAVAKHFGLRARTIQKGFDLLETVPGRMERVEEGQKFTVFVDYAHEQEGLKALIETADEIKQKGAKTIVLTGGQGGGRDKVKRPEMGEIAGRGADYVVIANEDPFDDDPAEIIEEIAAGARTAGKTDERDLFCIVDRRQAIEKALRLAKPGDLVFITGKGAEQSLIEKGRKIPWDDRKIVRELLKKKVKNDR